MGRSTERRHIDRWVQDVTVLAEQVHLMQALASIDGIAFSELNELCRNPDIRSPYPPNGAFVQQERGERRYWYFKGYEKPIDGANGRQTFKYVGAVGDPLIERLVEDHGARRATFRKRRDLATRLRRSGLPAPQPVEGAIASVLADAGLFEAGSTLVGSVAFQTYAGLLGVRLTEAGYRTEDMDIAQPSALRIHPRSHEIDVLAALTSVDPTFKPIFHPSQPSLVAGFKNGSSFKVEFLTPMRNRRDGTDLQFVEAAGLPGIGAQTLKFLEFLLRDTVTSVMLHDAGVSVDVPDPMRYASHKLMVSALRDGTAASTGKAIKDVRQAETLIEASVHARATTALGRMWLEAWNRGPRWRKLLREGSLKLASEPLRILAEGALEAGLMDGMDCPFVDTDHPRRALLGQAKTPVSNVAEPGSEGTTGASAGKGRKGRDRAI